MSRKLPIFSTKILVQMFVILIFSMGAIKHILLSFTKFTKTELPKYNFN